MAWRGNGIDRIWKMNPDSTIDLSAIPDWNGMETITLADKEIDQDVIDMVPADACAAAAMRMPPGDFLREMYSAMDDADKSLLNGGEFRSLERSSTEDANHVKDGRQGCQRDYVQGHPPPEIKAANLLEYKHQRKGDYCKFRIQQCIPRSATNQLQHFP